MRKVWDVNRSKIVHEHYIHFIYDTENEYKKHRDELEAEGYEIGRIAMRYGGGYAKVYYCKESVECI